MKAMAVVGKKPEIKQEHARPIMVRDSYGRNITTWTQPVAGEPEGPISVVLAVDDGKARVYLTKEEAQALALEIAECADTLPDVL